MERDILSTIQYGHRDPTKRLKNPVKDRRERAIIEAANKEDDCIINVGNGYYRPIEGDPVDEKEFNEYIAKERHRATEILSKCLNMALVFRGLKNEANNEGGEYVKVQ